MNLGFTPSGMNLTAVFIADYVALVLIICLLFSSRIRRTLGGDEFKIMSFILRLAAVASIIDFFAFRFDGSPGKWAYFLNLFNNTCSFITNPVFVFSWCLYADVKLYKSRARIKNKYKYIGIPAFLLALGAIVNIFVPLVFYIDENNIYHRLPISYVYYIVDAFDLAYSVYIFKNYENKYGKIRFFPIYLMLGPIVVGCTLQSLYYGVSLIWVSLAVGLAALYMAEQNEFSYIDPLTGLFNRAYLDYQMDDIRSPGAGKVGGIMIDVDYFKVINDTYGHSAGDEALVDVARIILFSKPDTALAIRFAGDEFILIMRNTSERAVERTVDNIRKELESFNEHEQRQYKLSLSIGHTMYDRAKDTSDSFFKKMDDDMYQEKQEKHSKK